MTAKKRRRKRVDVMDALVELGAFTRGEANRLSGVFEFMETAERRIAFWKGHKIPEGTRVQLREESVTFGVEVEERLKGKKRAEVVNDTFVLLRVPGVVRDLNNKEIFAAHCDELIKRVLLGGRIHLDRWHPPTKEALSLATHAEILGGLSIALGRAPLNDGAAKVYQMCFSHCLPGKWEELMATTGADINFRESWEGEAAELFGKWQYGMRDTERVTMYLEAAA